MDTTSQPAPGISALLRRHRPLRRLLAALATSQLGDWLYNLALLAFVFERTHSVAWTAAATAARVAPMVVLGPFGGVLADRYHRLRLMVAADLIRAGLMAALAVVAVAGLPVVLAPVLAAAATAVSAVYPPAVAGSLQRLVDPAELAPANAARSMISSAAVVAGPASGAILLALGSPATAFAVNAVTFAVSAICLVGLPAGALAAPARTADEPARAGTVLRELRDGALALWHNRSVSLLVGADIVTSLLYGAQTVLLLLLSGRLGYGGTGFGYLLAGFGVGGLAGAAVAAKLGRARQPRYAVALVLAAVAVASALFAVVPYLVAAAALAVAVGTGQVVVEVLTDTALTREVDEAVVARAYGIAFPASIGGIVLGSLVAAPLVGLFGLGGALVATAAVAGGYALAMGASGLARRAPRPDPVVVGGVGLPTA